MDADLDRRFTITQRRAKTVKIHSVRAVNSYEYEKSHHHEDGNTQTKIQLQQSLMEMQQFVFIHQQVAE
jgi:hypothetical protein